MSGNSAFRRRQTVPIVRSCARRASGRSRDISAGGRSAGICRSGSRRRPRAAPTSTRLRLTNVPLRLPWSSIEPAAVALDEHGVLARDGDVVEEDAAVGRAPDRRALARAARTSRPARPPPERTTSAGPWTPSSPSASSSSSRSSGVNVCVCSPLSCVVQERAALRAVVRGLRVLEAALGAVDVAHSLGRRGLPGEDLGQRRRRRPGRGRCGPPVFCRRATSSARRMSIFPCRMRRRYETSCSSCVYSSIRPFRSSSDSEPRSGSGSTRDLSLGGSS